MTYTESQLAKIIIDTLRDHGVDPTDDFTAAAGKDNGYVAAYELANNKGYAIAFGDNGETNYAIFETADDLGDWLIRDDLSGLDSLRAVASVYGISSIDPAARDSTNPCAVLISREFYGPYSHISVAMDDNGQHEAEFDSFAAAQAWIDAEEEDTYVLDHNETGRPTYVVVEL